MSAGGASLDLSQQPRIDHLGWYAEFDHGVGFSDCGVDVRSWRRCTCRGGSEDERREARRYLTEDGHLLQKREIYEYTVIINMLVYYSMVSNNTFS